MSEVMDKVYAELAAEVSASNDIYIYGEINRDTGLYVINKLQKLSENKNIDSVNIHINSYGGMTSIGLAIASAISESRLTVNTIVEGCAHSAAMTIAISGTKRTCIPGSTFVWHSTSLSYVGGTALDINTKSKIIGIHDATCNKLICKHSNKPLSFWEKIEKQNTDMVLSPEEALELGLVDDIIG